MSKQVVTTFEAWMRLGGVTVDIVFFFLTSSWTGTGLPDGKF
jgi:hypothetical protein